MHVRGGATFFGFEFDASQADHKCEVRKWESIVPFCGAIDASVFHDLFVAFQPLKFQREIRSMDSWDTGTRES